jgi:2-iminobutanoate/2-iminopropanoate deaminase
MSKTAITSPELTPPVGPFSQAIEVGGFLYFSGQVAQDPATGKVVEGGIVAEDRARPPEPLGSSQGRRQEFR